MFQVLLPEQEVSVWPNGTYYGNGEKNWAFCAIIPVLSIFGWRRKSSCPARLKISSTAARSPFRIDADSRTQGPTVYRLNSWQHYMNLDKVNGVLIRREVPNRPKSSDLNYQSPRLQVLVSIQDVKTVGDLIARIADKTKLELYANLCMRRKR